MKFPRKSKNTNKMMMRKNRPLALYIHIPFCQKICDYCDFTKLQYFRNFASPYIESLKQEIEHYSINYKLKTIYIGGGTPTVLEDDLFKELLSFIDKYRDGVEEYTIECNPESLSDAKLALMKKHGVNRLSIGVESTNDNILKAIGRNHTFLDVENAILRAKAHGFDNINVDLIIGLPNVTKELLLKDLNNILSLDVQHISCYSLTVHPNTKFYLDKIEEPDGDTARELYDLVNEKLGEKGFIHYEVSNWAKLGRESKHNYVYWKDEEYYGAGLGASGYIDNHRYTNTKNIIKYLSHDYIDEDEVVSIHDDKTYFIMLNLRTKRGLIFKEYEERFSEKFEIKNEDKIKKLEKLHLLNVDNDKIVATYEGMMILDKLIMEFIED